MPVPLPTSKPTPTPTGSPFKVRSGRRGDVESLKGLMAEFGYPDAVDAQIVSWLVSHPESELIVAVDALDRPIGVVTLSHRPQLRLKGRVATIDELVVAQAWRRKGVGRTLLQRAVERSKVLSVRRIEIATPGSNEPAAVAFLEACGFKRVTSTVCRHPCVEPL